MSASTKAKAAGFENLIQVITLSGYPRSTLDDMESKHPVRFETILLGSMVKLNSEKEAT